MMMMPTILVVTKVGMVLVMRARITTMSMMV